MGKDGKDRQAEYKQRLLDADMQIVKFPLEREYIKKALELSPEKGKQQALHDVIALALTDKTVSANEEEQLNIMDAERNKMLAQLDAIKSLAKDAKQEIAKAMDNPKTKTDDPAKVPTWKNLHKFLTKLEELL